MANPIFRRQLADRLLRLFVITFSMMAALPLILIVWQLISQGYKQFNIYLFTHVSPTSLEAMTARLANRTIEGGILNGISGTFIMGTIATLPAVAIGIFAGIYLAEAGQSKRAAWLRSIVDILQGVPSVVIGIVVYMWVVRPMSGFSGLAGGVALAIMMLPMIVRSTEESVKLVPHHLREAAAALGASYTTTLFRVILPTAAAGLLTGILLALSRVLGETAPLLMTALGANLVRFDPSYPMSAISLLIWEFYNDPNLVDLVWASSLLLLMMIFFLNLVAKKIAKKWKIQ